MLLFFDKRPSCAGLHGIRYPFLTLKERDIETGLDYFLARYYSSTQGRFTSPDDFTGGPDELFTFADDASNNPTFYADLTNPQSLNKYQYAYGNPLRFVDPDGHDPEPDPEPQDPCGCKDIQKTANQIRSDVEKLDEATSKPLFPITDIIGTSTPPPLGPVALPNDPTRVEPNTQSWPQGWPKAQTGPIAQPKAPPPPSQARHRTNRRPSNRPKHEEGDRRRKKDQGGEKADPKRERMPWHRKRPNKWKGPWPPKPPAKNTSSTIDLEVMPS